MTSLPKPGDRIRLVTMPDVPDPIQAGAIGTVIGISHQGDSKHAWHQVDVEWGNGRSLMLTLPPDRIEILRNASAT